MSEPVQESERALPPGSGGTRQPAINAPKVVLVLFALMMAVRGLQSFVSREGENWLLLNFALIPARYDVSNGLIYPGGWAADAWVFVTHMFLHGDWLHLAINCFFMLAFGSVLARRLGTAKFLLFSLVAGLGAASVHLWAYWGDQAPLIGASGAISGQMAGTVRLMFARRVSVFDVHRHEPGQMQALRLREVFHKSTCFNISGDLGWRDDPGRGWRRYGACRQFDCLGSPSGWFRGRNVDFWIV